MTMNQEHAAARNFNPTVWCTNRGFISGKGQNFSVPHSAVENLSGVQICKNITKITEESSTVSENFRKQTDKKLFPRILLLLSRRERLKEKEVKCFPHLQK